MSVDRLFVTVARPGTISVAKVPLPVPPQAGSGVFFFCYVKVNRHDAPAGDMMGLSSII